MKQEFINTDTTDLGISLYGCCRQDSGDPLCMDAADIEHFSVIYVSDGAGEVTIGKKSHFVTKGEAFVFRPGKKVSCRPDRESSWSVYRMDFGGNDAEFYLSEAGFTADTSIKKASGAGFMSAVMNCLDLTGENLTQARHSALLLSGIGSHRLKKTHKKRSDPTMQVKKAVSFIEHNYMRGITAGDAAISLNIDRSHFFRIFKARVGMSPEQYIMKCRVDNARRMLENGENTVTEIAASVGVRDVYYFSKLFKKLTGMSPTEYRKVLNK